MKYDSTQQMASGVSSMFEHHRQLRQEKREREAASKAAEPKPKAARISQVYAEVLYTPKETQ